MESSRLQKGMRMKIKIRALGPGVAVVADRATDRPLMTVERGETSGEWFAYPSPSHADQMAYQSDRVEYAIVWAPTRRACVQRALAALGG